MATNVVTGQSLATSADPTFAGETIQGQATIQPTSPISNPPYSLVFDESSTNLILNPSFEVDTSSWAAIGANASISRVTTEKYVGSAALQVVVSPAAQNQGVVSSSISVSSSTTYVISFWLKGTTGAEYLTCDITGNISGVTQLQALGPTTGWLRFSEKFTTGGSDTSITVRVVTNSVASATFYIDGVQLELNNPAYPGRPTSYLDGSLGKGYSWSGTAHSSTSSRVAGLHVLAPMDDSSANPFVVKRDGSTVAHSKLEFAEGSPAAQADVTNLFGTWTWRGNKPSASNIGGLEALATFENTGNGVGLWIKSAATTESVIIVDGGSITTGSVLAVAAPSDLSNFSGYYMRFFDKSNKDMFSVKRDTLNWGNVQLGWTKSFIQYGGGLFTETSGANLTGTAAWSGTAITGTGSTFTTDLSVGSVVTFTGSTQKAIIESITSNTAAVATAAASPAIAATTFQKKSTQYAPTRMFLEGPNGDHLGLAKGDATTCLFQTDADFYRSKTTDYTTGAGTLAFTSGSGLLTASTANAGIAVGDWIHAPGQTSRANGHVPVRVLRVVSTTQWQVAPVAAATWTTASGNWAYQKANQLTTPSSSSDGRSVHMTFFTESSGGGPTASTAETSIFASTLPVIRASQMSTNRPIRVISAGTLSGANAGKTLTFRVKLGSTTVLTTHAEVIADTSSQNWFMTVIIFPAGSEAAQNISLHFTCQSPTTSTPDHIIDFEQATVATDADQALDITAQWGVAASTLTAFTKVMEAL